MNYHYAKFHTNISINMDTRNIFPFLEIFFYRISTILPPIALFGPVQLDIIAYIVSEIMNYQYAKFQKGNH